MALSESGGGAKAVPIAGAGGTVPPKKKGKSKTRPFFVKSKSSKKGGRRK